VKRLVSILAAVAALLALALLLTGCAALGQQAFRLEAPGGWAAEYRCGIPPPDNDRAARIDANAATGPR
jgi:hypothetical protein